MKNGVEFDEWLTSCRDAMSSKRPSRSLRRSVLTIFRIKRRYLDRRETRDDLLANHTNRKYSLVALKLGAELCSTDLCFEPNDDGFGVLHYLIRRIHVDVNTASFIF